MWFYMITVLMMIPYSVFRGALRLAPLSLDSTF